MRTLVRAAIGFALFAGGLTFLVYGIAQAIENGNCGTDEYGNSVGPPCPSGFGPMILLMVLGTFVALIGTGIASARGRRGAGVALVGGMARCFAALTVAGIAGVVLGIVDVHADDTRPGLEIVAAVVAPVLLFALPGIGRRPPAGRGPSMAPVTAPRSPSASAEDIAARLRQLDQLKESGLLDEDEYKARRKQILAEL
jgi:putative oligomerization/nucleic acid binding protein